MFRISSIIGIMTYLWHLGFIPIICMLIASLIINQICLRKAMNYVPNWLILFMSLFVPVCFSTKDWNKSRQKEAKMIQKKTFFYQTCASILIYGGSILIIMILVNNSSINYEEEIILNNQRFNAYGVLVLIMGLFSFILSFSPKCSELFSCQKSNQDEETQTVVNINFDFKSLKILYSGHFIVSSKKSNFETNFNFNLFK